MKISELIARLQNFQQSLGDVEVMVPDINTYAEFGEPKEFDDSTWAREEPTTLRISS